MKRWAPSSWMVALVGCLVYLGTTAALIRPAEFAAARALRKAGHLSADDDPSWRFNNPEFDQWVADLKSERAALAERQRQLKQWQTRLEAQSQEFAAATQAVYRLQKEFDQNVVRLKASETQNLQHRAKLLSAMAPQAVASLVNQMPDEDLVRLLAVMRPDSASQILNVLAQAGTDGAKRAARLTERLQLVVPIAAGKSPP